MNLRFASVVAGAALLLGCGTSREYRSADLSNERPYNHHHRNPSAQLSENEVLGLKEGGTVTDREIQRILDEAHSFNLQANSTVLLVQSGASQPDAEMVRQLSKHFTVVPSSGKPADLRSEGGGDTARSLRLSAAHAKAEAVIVYWPEAEMKRDDLPTSIVSWVPVVDFVVPDEYQKVRMHVKVALIDVRSGQWATFRTEPVEDKTLTTRYAREKAPEWPLASIKSHAYDVCVRKLVDGYVVTRN